MKSIVATFFRGLSLVLPLALTVWFIYWLATTSEHLLRTVFLLVLPQELYLPGLGLALGMLIIFGAGLLAQVFLLQRVWGLLEALLERIPVVKTVYHAISDLVSFLSTSNINEGAARVVRIELGNGMSMIGLVTDSGPLGEDADTLAVYLPMSYNVGGYTILVPQSIVRDSNMSVEQALRWTMTAGIGKR